MNVTTLVVVLALSDAGLNVAVTRLCFLHLPRARWTTANDLRNPVTHTYGHHEKLKGSGYPRRLTSEHIPLETRSQSESAQWFGERFSRYFAGIGFCGRSESQ